MNKKILLTISILISNRLDTVRKCLDSIKPLLEQVPSELILVDTGCGEQEGHYRGIHRPDYRVRVVQGLLQGPIRRSH